MDKSTNIKHSACPICNSSIQRPLNGYEETYLVKCKSCKMVYSECIPTDSELLAYYSNYTRGNKPSELTFKRYNSLLEEFDTHVSGKKILDVGCGSGFFIETAQKKGWISEGTEYDDPSIEYCRSKGLKVYQGPIEQIQLQENSYDVITSFEVIEHLSFPSTHVERLFDLLKPGGILYMTTPNFNAVTRHILKSDWNVITYPEHLSYFSPKTMNRMLKKTGFKKVKIVTNGISIDRLRASLNYQKRKPTPKRSDKAPNTKTTSVSNEAIRNASENYIFIKVLRKCIDEGLNFTQSGEFLKALYRKPY